MQPSSKPAALPQAQTKHLTKKQLLKNLKSIKTNNQDYIVMQNIRNQMGSQLNPGLNTTKNKKSNDKSL